jgi:histone H4
LHEFSARRAAKAAERAERFGELFPCSTLTSAKYSRCGFEGSIEEHEKEVAKALVAAENVAKDETRQEEADHREQAEAERAREVAAKQEEGYVPLTAKQEKNRRLHSQSLALIRRMQCEESSAKRVIPCWPLVQLCMEIGENFKSNLFFSPVAINLLGELLETYVVGLFEDGKLNAIHIHRKRMVTDTSLLVGKRVKVKWSGNRTHPGVFDSIDNDGKLVVLYDDGDKKSYALRTSDDGQFTTLTNEKEDVHIFFVNDGTEFFGEEQKEQIAAVQQKHEEVQAARDAAKEGAARRRPSRVGRDNIQGITKHHINRLAARGGCIKVSKQIYEEVRDITRVFLESILKDTITFTQHERSCTVAPEHVLSACDRQGRMLWGTGRLPLPVQSVHPYQFKGPYLEDSRSNTSGGFLHEFTVRRAKNAAENPEYSPLTYAKYSRCAFDGSIEEHEKEVAKVLVAAENLAKEEEALPTGWSAQWDNTRRAYYYYHAALSSKRKSTEELTVAAEELTVGTIVHAPWKKGGSTKRGVIIGHSSVESVFKHTSRKTFNVRFDDGDKWCEPTCKRGHKMIHSIHTKRAYGNWYCDNCQAGRGSNRWFCKACKKDICFDCHPATQGKRDVIPYKEVLVKIIDMSQWERPTSPPPGVTAATAASPVTAAIPLNEKQEKNRRLHSQSLELVRNMQRSTERVIPCKPLARLCMEVGQEFKSDLCFSPVAINLIGERLEIYLVGLFEDSNLNAIRDERIAVNSKDILTARRIRGERL